MHQTRTQLTDETQRLYEKLHVLGWTLEDCALIAPLTYEINELKKEQQAIILAHSYQTPDIMYGVADFLGDSYGLSVTATKQNAKKIIFCSVEFMGETAKLLNPEKEVILPDLAGCSLADSITAEDVRKLKAKYPNAGVVSYVNTSAAVKAECDACCTSANVVQIVDAMPQNEIIFIPDELMGKNLQKLSTKKIHTWNGRCVVHEIFGPETVDAIRVQYPGVKVLAHMECSPAVVDKVDLVGGTMSMLDYMKKSNDTSFMLVTECGISDRARAEFPNKKIVGTCSLCPYMKKIMLKDILTALKNPRPEQIITIPEDIAVRARRSLEYMFELEKKKEQC